MFLNLHDNQGKIGEKDEDFVVFGTRPEAIKVYFIAEQQALSSDDGDVEIVLAKSRHHYYLALLMRH